MKRLTKTVKCIVLLLLIMGTSVAIAAPTLKFRVMFVGIQNYANVDAVITPLSHADNIIKLVPSFLSQGNIQYDGEYEGFADGIISDIRGLCVNRFDIKISYEDSGFLIIVLHNKR